MAESISIPLTHIQSILDETPPFWIYSRLYELKYMLSKIQQSTDYKLLQNLSIDHCKQLEKMSNDIRQFSYHIDDQLDAVNINIQSCGRWISSSIPNVIKTLGIAYHKSKSLHIIKSLINLVEKNKFVESLNFDIKEWNELERLTPFLHHYPNSFSYDFEQRISSVIISFWGDLDKPIIKIDLSRDYVSVKELYVIILREKSFQYIAWVSLKYSSKRIFVYRDILKQLFSSDHKKNDVVGLMAMNEDELRKELMEVLTSYKCLIILTFDESIDDQNLVDQFNIPMRSKLLVFTHEDYLNCNHLFPYDRLDCNDFFSYGPGLLESITIAKSDFVKEYLYYNQLEPIGRLLIEKCNGKPRQIIRIGGILRRSISINHWQMVQRSLSYRNYSDNHWKIVALGYDHLPIYLKACFLYFGQFWKDIDISTEMLYQMWMAEGIITTIDIAEEYLAILARMLLIDVQESNFSTSRRFVFCRIDDIIKNFCLHPEVIEATSLPYQVVENTLYGLKSSSRDGFRLSMKFDISSQEIKQNGIDVEILNTIRLASNKLHSLLFQKENGLPPIKISFPFEICKKFKFLRVLKIENFEIHGGNLPKDIKTLIHLRFLSLEGSTFEEFPETLGNFRFMQTLDLRVTEIIPRGIVVPNVLWKLKELINLYLPICHRLPKGKDKLSLNGLNKLETLVNFDIDKVELTSLESKILRHIDARVHGKKSICDVIDYINKSGDQLKETFLNVSFSNFSYEESDVPIEEVFNCSKINHFMVNWGRCDLNKFKNPRPFSSNLIELCLIRCQIREDPMPTLGKFPQLRKLFLEKKSFMGRYMTFEDYSFMALRHLKIENLPYLEDLEIYYPSLSNLSCLEIICCPKLNMIPYRLRLLRNMIKLNLIMPKNFNDRLRGQDENEGEDFKTVKHVPFIFLEDL